MRLLARYALTALIAACLSTSRSESEERSVSFGRDVRPILAKHCFKCHGPDPNTREADLRLDQQEDALADLGGYAAIVPGDVEQSELIVRVISDDDDLRMPPSDTGPPLKPSEIQTLRDWISQGGRYETHWAFVPPHRSPIPEVQSPSWCRGEIDRFILHRMEKADLRPASATSRESLIRRLYLDLTGTTPSPEEVECFVNDTHPASVRKLVDQLLASPAYGERFARSWLDLARYSDTNGYEKDRPRTIWPYRDWVIDALINDMPFDQFSIEQMAGDMLPNADTAQMVATGFHRNTMLNEEGGIDPLEYRFYALVDRVATTGTVWMGMTTGCAQCHTHKYDPITHHDYYSMMALMNHADEPDVLVKDPTRERLAREVEGQVDEAAERLIEEHLPTLAEFRQETGGDSETANAFEAWFQTLAQQTCNWRTLRPASMTSTMPKLILLDDDSVLASGDVTKRDVYELMIPLEAADRGASALRLEVLPHDSLPAGGPGMAFYEGRRGDFFLSELRIRLDGEPIGLKDPSHSFGKISVGSGSADAANVIDGEGSTGWSTSGAEGQANQLVVNFARPLPASGQLEVEFVFERHFAAALGHFRLSLTTGRAPVVASRVPVQWETWLTGMTARSVTEPQYKQLQKHFVLHSDVFAEQRKHIEKLRNSIPEEIRTLGIQQRNLEDYRTTYRHHRGEYLQPKEQVEPGVPEVFRHADDAPVQNRLDLARWLVSSENPLVGRVTVNRAWREFFGVGIVDTAGDFGTQSQPPTHPELLDDMAIDFVSQGWSLKRLHRKIVASSTYRQSVAAPPPIDPENQLLSVFPQRRFNAEQIRDAFLSAAGVLSNRVGGPSVYPPQPASVMQMAYGSPDWPTSQGADRFRRSIYTFSKRTAPFAAYTAFDGPTGEVCLARRDRSTTPLQALTLLNDEMYIEIAAELALQTLRDVGPDASPQATAQRMFRRLLVRKATPSEVQEIVAFYEGLPQSENRWMLVARALMNTDEAITTP